MSQRSRPEAPGNSWWPTSFLAPSRQIEPFVAAGLSAMREAVATLEAEGLPRERIWLCGFSQGACLALEAFARDGTDWPGSSPFLAVLSAHPTRPAGAMPALYGHAPKRFDYAGATNGRAGLDQCP